MTTTSLASFPPEILRQIFSNFCLHCLAEQHFTAPDAYYHSSPFQQQSDKPSWYSLYCQALFSLCLVSSTFCSIAQPILYHEFMPGYADSWRSTVYRWDGRLTSFMRTMIERRDLALLVKRIYIHPLLISPVTPDEAQGVIRQAADALGITSWQQLSAGDLVGILVAGLPNLEQLSLQFKNPPMSWSGLHAASMSSLPLKTIDICSRQAASISRHYMINLREYASGLFEFARNIETLNIHMCEHIGFPTSVNPLPHLKFLRITWSRISDNDIERLLSSSTSLQTFFYEATNPPIVPAHFTFGRCRNFQFSSVVRYLHPHRHTLTSLHIDLRNCGWNDLTDIQNSPPLISLKEFSKLEHLFLNYDEMYNAYQPSILDGKRLVKLLPASIVSLHLAHYSWAKVSSHGPKESRAHARFAQGLITLAKAIARGRFPMLKEVRCDVEDEENLEEFGVADEYADRNIDFGYIFWPQSSTPVEESDLSPPRTPPPMPLPEYDDEDL